MLPPPLRQPSPASAQSSVTLYGVVDDALTYLNNQNGHSNVYLRQGNLYSSKFGIKGTEDLGGGIEQINSVNTDCPWHGESDG